MKYIPRNHRDLVSSIKGGTLLVHDDEEGEMLVLVKHHDKFEWMDITECLPSDSEREYPIELAEVVNIK